MPRLAWFYRNFCALTFYFLSFHCIKQIGNSPWIALAAVTLAAFGGMMQGGNSDD